MGRSLRAILNEANPNKLATGLQMAGIGAFLAAQPRWGRFAVVANKIVLPENAKCAVIHACYVTAGTVSGRFTPVWDSTPATTQVSADAAGDLVFLNTDAVTVAEVLYVPHEGEVYEDVVAVAANVGAPQAARAIAQLISVTVTKGTALGAKTLIDRAGAPAAGQAATNLAGSGVAFNAADAVTEARIKYVAVPGVGTARKTLGVRLDEEIHGF